MVVTLGVVTLSRNQGNYIAQTVTSVLEQNPNSYVIYDCGSTDSSRSIINAFANPIIKRKFVDSDLGPSDGLNSALKIIKEDVFYYLNSDDIVVSGAFDFVKKYFDDHPNCDILHGSIEIIDQHGAFKKKLPSINFSLRGIAYRYCVVYQQATFIRRSCLQEISFNTENRTCWDGELIVDLALAGFNIHRTNKVLGRFRIYPDSITGSGKFKTQMQEDHKRISQKILGRNPRFYELLFGFIFGKILALRRRLLVIKSPYSN